MMNRGTSSIEILMSFTLLSTVLVVSTPLIVKQGRILKEQRDYRLAIDELSNQIERLAVLSDADLPAAIENLTPSEFSASRLPEAKLSVELEKIDIGSRVTLRLSWDQPQRREAPVSLTAWVVPSPPGRSQP